MGAPNNPVALCFISTAPRPSHPPTHPFTLHFMEIHAPERPIDSFKDFALHIAIVTCGILIALGLEGLREFVHNRHLVRETRESVRFEMEVNLDHGTDEFPRVAVYNTQLKSLIKDLPTLAAQHPEQVNQRLDQIVNPGYFFLSNSWQSALSTGALEHMSTAEVSAYGGAAEVIKIYSDLQHDAEANEARAKAFFTAHPRLTPDQLEEGTERLLLFSRAEEALSFVGPQLKHSLDSALKAASSQ